MKTLSLLPVAALLLLGAHTAEAANFLKTCNGKPVGHRNATLALSASSAGFPAGDIWDTSLRVAIAHINENPSKFRLSIANNSDTSVAIGNGQSEVWWSSNASESSPAVTYNYYVCDTATGVGYISESDVLFYNGEPYTANMAVNSRLYGYGGSLRPFQTTAVHELGHALGLGHVNTEYNIMGTDFYFMTTNGGVARSYLGADASDGAVQIYGGSTGAVQDVSLSHWKYSGASGQYSSHAKTIITDAAGTELSSAVDAGEKRYAVTAGQSVQLELTRENNGQNAQNVRIGYYLSADSTISSADQRLAVETLTVNRSDPTTFRKALTLPTGLASGKYWLGAIIDDDNALAENVEDNNAMYIPVSYTGSGGGNQPPVANFSVAVNGLTATFTDGSTDADGSIASRAWNFGDGTTSTATNPSKTYAAAGTYTVSLTVTDNQGATHTTNRSVTVSAGGGGLPECTSSRTDELGKNCSRSNLSESIAGRVKYFFLFVPAGTTQLRITTTGGTGNADLYYSASTWAGPASYTSRSINAGNSETITVNNPPGNSYVYVSVHAASAYSGVKVSTEY